MAVRTCPFCGGELKAEILGGLCPQCVLKQTAAEDAPPPASHRAERDASPAATESRKQKAESGKRFGDYELLEKVAEGGMGVVYRARQLSLNRIVAVKLIQPGRVGSPEMVLRFRAEAEAAASLHHPNIVTVHETGECEGQHYFSMDFIAGQNLAEAVREGPLPLARAAQLVAKIAAAVHHAHQHKILHRDLKPSNVILDAAGEPQVTDFGLAKRLSTLDSRLQTQDLTLTGQVFGSPRFMPPEQASGRSGAVGVHSDVYGLGAILYYLMTARPPFVGETVEMTLAQVLEQDPVPPRLLSASVPRDLETICLKCLEKEPSRRYASAQAVADELGRFLEQKPILARPVSPPEKLWRWCRRKPALAAALGAVVLVAVVGFVGVFTLWRRAVASELFARQNAYAADMNLVQRALAANDVKLAVNLLNKHRPAESSLATRHPSLATDLRGWEWRYLWQLCQADACVRLQTNSGSIGQVALSQDGKVLAVENGRDKVALWDLTTKRQMTELSGSTSIRQLALSATGDRLAVSTLNALGEPTVEVWDVPASVVRATFDLTVPIKSLAFSPDGTLLASFDDHGKVGVVEWASRQVVTNFTALRPRHSGAGIVTFSPDGDRVAIGQDYGRINLLNWRTGVMLTITNLHQANEAMLALAFSPTTGILAAGFQSFIRLWDADTGQPRGQLPNLSGSVRALAFTPDSARLAAANSERRIMIWNIADQTELGCWQGHVGEGRALAFLSDGKTLVSGCDASTACSWDVSATNRSPGQRSLEISYGLSASAALEGKSFETLDAKVVRRLGFTFTRDSGSFITTDHDGGLGVWDTRSVQQIESLSALGSNHWGVALSPDDLWLATGDAAQKVQVWDWAARRRATSFPMPFQWFGDLRFSSSGRFLCALAVFQDRTTHLRLWRTNDWQEVPLNGVQVAGVCCADLSPDDRWLATGYLNGGVKLWAFPSGRLEATFTNQAKSLNAVVFSPDGRMLASTGSDGSVRLRDLITRREVATLPGHSRAVWGAAFSPDGRRLATGGNDSREAVKLWDLATKRELVTLPRMGDYFIHVAFSPDGSTLMATSFAGIAHLWRAPTWEEIEAAEKGAVTP